MPKLDLPSVDEIEDVQSAVDHLLERKEELEEFVDILPNDRRSTEQIEELDSAVERLLDNQEAINEFSDSLVNAQLQVRGLIESVDDLLDRVLHAAAVIEKFAADAEHSLR